VLGNVEGSTLAWISSSFGVGAAPAGGSGGDRRRRPRRARLRRIRVRRGRDTARGACLGVGVAEGELTRRGRRLDAGAWHGGGHGVAAAAWRRCWVRRGTQWELELHLLEAVGACLLLHGSAGRRLVQHARMDNGCTPRQGGGVRVDGKNGADKGAAKTRGARWFRQPTWHGWTTSDGARDDVTDGRRPRGRAPTAGSTHATCSRAPKRGVHVVNTGLTVYISKKFNYTSKTPNTKVWAGIPGYNFCKARHMFWGVVWLGMRVEVGPMQNSEKLCILPLTKILGIYHSEFGMPPVRWNVFPEITNNFLICRFCSAYAKFWERARLLQAGPGF
jgi:hypothetical protein